MADQPRSMIGRLCGVLLALATAARAAAADDRLALVNPLQGTDSNIGLSHGGTLPLVATPWGMTNWAPQTNGGWGWWFHPDARQCRGLRATHQPSPWMGDYGQVLLMPQAGPLVTDPERWASPYDPAAATFGPDYLQLDLPRYDVGVELTATDRCAVLRLTYRSGPVGRLLIDPAEQAHVEVAGRTVRGWTTAASGWGPPPKFKAYFVVQLDRDVTRFDTFPGSNGDFDHPAKQPGSTGGYAEFDVAANRTVTVRVGTSFIGYDQAEQNLRAEAAGDFDAVREATRREWADHLAKADVAGGTAEQRRTFYSCLYRAQLFPHRLYELDRAGHPVHYSPYDGGVHPGRLYGDNGFWDVYRTTYPLWSILYPEQEGEILDGFVNAADENGGWFPQWPSPGNRTSMIGTHVDAVVADAVAKHVGGFDVARAYAGLHKDAFDAPPPGMAVGRGGLQQYLARGYVPSEKDGYAASASLDYAYDDWCVAQVARALGKADDHDALMKRSQNYRASWDPAVGFFRPHTADGSWAFDPFDPLGWGHGYVEGGPWQCTWAVQHDVPGLAELMGGRPAMADKLDRMLGQPPAFHVGGFGGTIHEMTEMARADFGQYDQGNQPVHHVLYLYAAIGHPWKTQYWTRRVCRELYSAGPDGFPGDEDNGEMASWFVLSSTGLYPLCVGDPTYTLTSPLFDRVALHLPGGKTFAVVARHNEPHNAYVRGRTLDGQPYRAETIPHATVTAGGELAVDLAATPPDAASGGR